MISMPQTARAVNQSSDGAFQQMRDGVNWCRGASIIIIPVVCPWPGHYTTEVCRASRVLGSLLNELQAAGWAVEVERRRAMFSQHDGAEDERVDGCENWPHCHCRPLIIRATEVDRKLDRCDQCESEIQASLRLFDNTVSQRKIILHTRLNTRI